MQPWTAKVKICSERARLLVVDPDNNDVIKATLPPFPKHPRALLSLLEGIAQWEGVRISCVISAEREWPDMLGSERWEVDLHTTSSALISVKYAVPRPSLGRGRRITGIGDFRDVRALEPLGVA